ncbi:MAG TPA: sulfite exporter TauE/SafE family protein, partial [Desulfobacterales bacterium]|nr:sulfite exporter TauE/SafE family protein [Desulfobacterales bacterium]
MRINTNLWVMVFISLFSLVIMVTPVFAGASAEAAVEAAADGHAWWFWPLVLFIVTFIMGIFAVLGGVGGGVLFVPIISGFFPFHLDFVRGTGLLVALSGALAAGPGLLKMNLASLRLAIPVALIASTCAIIGAMIGLALPTNIVQIALGATILGICVLMLTAKKSTVPDVPQADRLSSALRICGVYQEASTGEFIDWKIHRTPLGLGLFILIGIMAGMFGLGAGWANVPVLNLLMGAPLKISVATSKFLLSITDTSAAWIY